MPTDQQVSARHVLQALMRLKRRGSQRALQELEQVEPDLAGYLMEELSLVHQKLLELGAPAGRTRWLVRRVESLALVLVAALRDAHYQMWKDAAAGTPLASLDPSLAAGPPAPEQPADEQAAGGDGGAVEGPDDGPPERGGSAPPGHPGKE